MSGCGYDSSSRHSKDWLRSPETSLRFFNLKETHTRVVLIFSQSWSSHGLEVSATDDPRQAATELTIKVCRFPA